MKFRANRPAIIPVPGAGGQALEAVSLVKQFPRIPLHNIRVADAVPRDEASPLHRWFYDFQVAMYRLFSPMQAGLPPIDADPQAALAAAYTVAHRRVFPMPVLPPEYAAPVDLGTLAVAGPYACYLERAPDGGYHWDLKQLARYEHHPGLRSLGVRVRFRANPSARRLETVGIDSELGATAPGDPEWDLATQLALAAATTHVSLVRHFNGVHLAAGGLLAIATRNALPPDHPVRRLLWPHMFGTQYSNQLVTNGQMSVGGDFETIFSFTHRGMIRLFAETYEEYDITTLHPARDAERRGLVGAGFDTPALDNRRAHFDVMRAHARRYLELYYASDAVLRADAGVRAWVQALEALVPNGISKVLEPTLTLDGLADLIGAFIYMGQRRARDPRHRPVELPDVEPRPARARLPERAARAPRRLSAARERELQPQRESGRARAGLGLFSAGRARGRGVPRLPGRAAGAAGPPRYRAAGLVEDGPEDPRGEHQRLIVRPAAPAPRGGVGVSGWIEMAMSSLLSTSGTDRSGHSRPSHAGRGAPFRAAPSLAGQEERIARSALAAPER